MFNFEIQLQFVSKEHKFLKKKVVSDPQKNSRHNTALNFLTFG